MTCRVCTRHNCQYIDDKTYTKQQHNDDDLPHNNRQSTTQQTTAPHHTTPRTSTFQQTNHTSFPTSVVLLRIRDQLLIALWRRAIATPQQRHNTTPPPHLPSLLSPSSSLRIMANCDPATHFNATEHLSISSACSSPLYFKWHEVCTGKTGPLCGASFSAKNEGPRSMHPGTKGTERAD